MTEAEKTIQGLVPVKLESGEYNLKFTNRSNQLIYEKTGKRMVEYLSNMHTEAIKKVDEVKKQTGVDAVYIEKLEDIAPWLKENIQAGDLIITMGAGNIYTVGENLAQSL